MDIITLALSKKYTEDTVIGLGALKGENCTIKDIEKKDGQNIVTFEWTATDGTKKEKNMYVNDGTPIYVWESGNLYHYGDLVIYSSAFYRCITENSDTVFDDTKWNEIGSSDGSYDIVETKELLPARFTAADRKMYYCISDMCFYLWDGTEWKPKHNVVQLSSMPTAGENLKDRIVQYTGTSTENQITGHFYKCILDKETSTYKWDEITTFNVEVDDFLDPVSSNPVANRVIVSELGAKQPIRLVSAVMLESHAYGEVETAMKAISTRLTDTMKRQEVEDGLNEKQNIILRNPMMFQSVAYNRTETALGALAIRLEDTYRKDEVDNSISAVVTGLDWKPTVDTYTDIMSEYPNPEDGWTVNVKDTDITYRYDDESGLWIPISANAIPKATSEVDGLLAKEDFVKLQSAVGESMLVSELAGKQNIILSNPVMIESASYGSVPTALSALGTRLSVTYTQKETDNLVDTKATKSIEDVANINRETLGYRRKNLLKPPVNQTASNVALSSDISGNVILNGTASSGTSIDGDKFYLESGEYILSVQNALPTGVNLSLSNIDTIMLNPTMSNKKITIETAGEYYTHIWINSGTIFSNFKLNPMLRPASVKDPTYVPYQGESVDYRMKAKDDYNLLELTENGGSIAGITYSIDATAGSVALTGTSTGNPASCPIADVTAIIQNNNSIAMSLQTTSNTEVRLSLYIYNNSTIQKSLTVYNGESKIFDLFGELDGIIWDKVIAMIVVANGMYVNNIAVYPMITSNAYIGMLFKPFRKAVLRESYAEVYGAKNLLDWDGLLQYVKNVRPNFAWSVDNGVYRVNSTSSLHFALSLSSTGGKPWRFAENDIDIIISAKLKKGTENAVYIIIYDNNNNVVAEQRCAPTDLSLYKISCRGCQIAISYGINGSFEFSEFMIRHASIQSDTYVPYAMTNHALTRQKLGQKYAEVYGSKNLFDGLFTSNSSVLKNGENYDATVIPRKTTSPRGMNYVTFGAYMQKGNYKLVDCTDLYLSINHIAMNGTTKIITYPLYDNDKTYTFTVDYKQWVYFTIERDTSVSDRTDINFDGTELQMMIVDASIESDKYEPHAKTNQDLTQDVAVLPGNAKKNYANNVSSSSYAAVSGSAMGNNGFIAKMTTTGGDDIFHPMCQLYNGNTKIQTITGSYMSFNGRAEINFKKDSTFNIVRYGHNDSTRDFKVNTDVSDLPDGEYILSFNVMQYNPSVDGCSFNQVMIRPAGTSPEFVPWCMSNDELTDTVENGIVNSAKYVENYDGGKLRIWTGEGVPDSWSDDFENQDVWSRAKVIVTDPANYQKGDLMQIPAKRFFRHAYKDAYYASATPATGEQSWIIDQGDMFVIAIQSQSVGALYFVTSVNKAIRIAGDETVDARFILANGKLTVPVTSPYAQCRIFK